MQTLLQDLRYALRQIRRAPIVSLTVILTLALSIGATAVLTGVLRATLLHRLPYPQARQLVVVEDENLRGFKSSGLMSLLRTQDLATLQAGRDRLFAKLTFWYSDDSTLTLNGQMASPVAVAAVSGTFFDTVGAAPLLGRVLVPADDVPNGPQRLVLSYNLWRTRFAGDPAIVGRVVRLGPDQATVVGVMPQSFALPVGKDVWHPGHVFPAMYGVYRGDGSRFVQVIGRLAPGQTPDTASAATSQLAIQLAKQFPETDAAWGFKLLTLRDSLFGSVRSALVLLAAAVGLVLLVAAVNIAGLQLSRNAARAPEFAIRAALGITPARLIRQLITESLLLTGIGTTAGLLLAAALLRVATLRLPAVLLLIEQPHLDAVTLAFAIAVALTVGLLTAALPALRARAQMSPSADQRLVSRRPAAGKVFAALQIALALVLLTLSASVLQSLYHLLTTPLGFDATNLQSFSVDLPWGSDPAKLGRLYGQLEESFAAIPGVSSVGSMDALPFTGFSGRRTFDIAGEPPTLQHDAVVAEGRAFSLGYLRTMRIPLLAGRAFTADDFLPNAPPVLLINQALARRYFAASNPVGKRLTYGDGSGKPRAAEIAGVIGDVHGTGGSLSSPIQPEVYNPAQGGWPHMQFVLRTPLALDALERPVKTIVAASGSNAGVGRFATLQSKLDATLVEPRLDATLLSAFAALSLLLVVIGVYGLVAFNVAQRTRELGLRLALGSTRGGIVGLLLTESLRILALGLGLGIACSLIASRLLTATLFGVQNGHAPLLLATTVVLSIAVLAATLIPARRAALTDPMIALRAE